MFFGVMRGIRDWIRGLRIETYANGVVITPQTT